MKVLGKSITLLGIALLTTLVWSQVQTGTISGTVRDSSGAIVPNANVTATNNATGAERTTQTGSEGQYTVPGLTPAVYEVTIKVGNFAPYKTEAAVTVGGVSTLDATLLPGGTSTTVEVLGAAGAAGNTETQRLSQVASPTRIA